MRAPISINAVGCVSAVTVRHAVEVSLSSLSSPSISFGTIAVVLKALTDYPPCHSINLAGMKHLSGLPWADPNPFNRDPIDLIIGADLYSELLCDGVRKGDVGQPIAQQTAFGWIISGPIVEPRFDNFSSRLPSLHDPNLEVISSSHCLTSLNDDLKRFWEVEDIPSPSSRSPDDERCENHFESKLTRDRKQVGIECGFR